MPLLAALFNTLFVGASTFFAAYIGSRAALVVAAIVVIGGMTVAIAASLSALVTSVFLAFPTLDAAVLSIIWMAVPDNATLCVGVMVSADGFCAAYRWGNQNVQMAARL